MKKIKSISILILYSIIFTQISFAQKKSAYEMNIEGVKVIVQPSGNEIVVIQTVFKGGVQNYPENICNGNRDTTDDCSDADHNEQDNTQNNND
jgi:hypothetical protein